MKRVAVLKYHNRANSNMRAIGMMRDSTFFHSGMTSLLDTVYNNSSVLFILMDNRITGMTGHGLEGPVVIITRWPYVLKKLTALDKEEFGDYFAKNLIDTDKCIGCRKCIGTGCPALNFDKERKKAGINRDSCVGCDICVQVCPAQAISREA